MKKSDELAIMVAIFRATIKEHLLRLRGEPALPPEASVVIPVNAQNDLQNVLHLVKDITAYQGKHRLEIILVINNYPPDLPPEEIEEYRALSLCVLAFPKIKERGEIYLTVRIPGVRIASSECTIHFDADCRLLDATHLIDWYIQQFEMGFQLAYTYVGYYDLTAGAAMKSRMNLYNAFRWFKRVVLRIPVSRGSNYAILRSLMLKLYDQGLLNYDIKVGTTIKSVGGKIAYSGEKSLTVLTSGRNFLGDWKELFEYIAWRMGYYRRLAPFRPETNCLKENPLQSTRSRDRG
jgi:hypothetical protein